MDSKSNTSGHVICDINHQGVALLSINRPEKHNAFNAQIIQALLSHLANLKKNPKVRCLILQGTGKHFSAGADLNWMKSMASKSRSDNQDDATSLAQLMSQLDTFPHPTLVRVQGFALGGALGLICCCDFAIALHDAQFGLSEVKIGLVPATIAPYVCRAIGTRQARRYMLTAERFNADTAQHIGLIHSVAHENEIEDLTNRFIASVLLNSPDALSKTKALCLHCDASPIEAELIDYTSQLIAEVRVSQQGQEGLNAFFDKRKPSWADESFSSEQLSAESSNATFDNARFDNKTAKVDLKLGDLGEQGEQ